MPIVLPKDLRFGFVVALLFKSLRYINNIVRFNTHNIKLRTRLGIWKLPDYWLLLLNHSVIWLHGAPLVLLELILGQRELLQRREHYFIQVRPELLLWWFQRHLVAFHNLFKLLSQLPRLPTSVGAIINLGCVSWVVPSNIDVWIMICLIESAFAMLPGGRRFAVHLTFREHSFQDLLVINHHGLATLLICSLVALIEDRFANLSLLGDGSLGNYASFSLSSPCTTWTSHINTIDSIWMHNLILIDRNRSASIPDSTFISVWIIRIFQIDCFQRRA